MIVLEKSGALYYRRKSPSAQFIYEYEGKLLFSLGRRRALSNVAPGDSQSESEICFLTEKIKERKLMIVLEKKRGLYYRRNRLRPQ